MDQELTINSLFPNRSTSQNLGLSSCSLESEILSPKTSSVHLTWWQLCAIIFLLLRAYLYSLLRSKTAEAKKTCRNTTFLSNLLNKEDKDYLEVQISKQSKGVVIDY